MNWIALECVTQFTVAATSHSALSSDETRSFEMRLDEISNTINPLHSRHSIIRILNIYMYVLKDIE